MKYVMKGMSKTLMQQEEYRFYNTYWVIKQKQELDTLQLHHAL
jgi:hypothetical protein